MHVRMRNGADTRRWCHGCAGRRSHHGRAVDWTVRLVMDGLVGRWHGRRHLVLMGCRSGLQRLGRKLLCLSVAVVCILVGWLHLLLRSDGCGRRYHGRNAELGHGHWRSRCGHWSCNRDELLLVVRRYGGRRHGHLLRCVVRQRSCHADIGLIEGRTPGRIHGLLSQQWSWCWGRCRLWGW